MLHDRMQGEGAQLSHRQAMDEPELKQLRCIIREQIHQADSMDDKELMSLIEAVVLQYSNREHKLSARQKIEAIHLLFHSFRGLDLLQPLMEDESITEIMINHHEEIFVERNGVLIKLQQRFESKERLEDLIQAIVSSVNRVVNESSPIVDARLKDGSRVHVVLPPVALKGPCMTIRKFPDKPLTMEHLIAFGSISNEAAELLRVLIEAQYNIFISGGTGTGKTTFLNVLSQYIPNSERVITIEDSAELQLKSLHNVVTLETRNANTEGKGEIAIKDLIRAALRMRPNRIIVGEVRGEEALDMLQALNTGHAGSLSTGHGNSAQDMMSRLETMVLSAAQLPLPVIRKQIASAIDIVIHLTRYRDGSRKVSEICEVIGMEQGEIKLQPLYQFVEEAEQDGSFQGRLLATPYGLIHTEKLYLAGRECSQFAKST